MSLSLFLLIPRIKALFPSQLGQLVQFDLLPIFHLTHVSFISNACLTYFIYIRTYTYTCFHLLASSLTIRCPVHLMIYLASAVLFESLRLSTAWTSETAANLRIAVSSKMTCVCLHKNETEKEKAAIAQIKRDIHFFRPNYMVAFGELGPNTTTWKR